MAATAEKTISSKFDQFDNAQTSLSNKEGQTKKVPSNSNRKDRPTSNGGEVIRKTKLINDGNVKAPSKNASEGKEQKAGSSGDKNKSEVNKSSGNEEGKSNNNPPHNAKKDVSINHTTKSEKRTGTKEQAIKRASSTGSARNEKRSGTREQCISRRASTGIATTGKHQLNRVTSSGSGDNKNKPETMNKAKKPATGHSDIAKKQKKDDDINQTTTLSENNGSTDRHMKRDQSSGNSGNENKRGKALSNKGNTHGGNKNEHHTKTEDHAKNELHAPKRDSKRGIVGVSMDHSRLSAGSSNQRPSRGRSYHVEKGVRFKQQRGRSLVVTTSRTSGGRGNGTSEKVVVDQSGVTKSSNNNDDDNVKKRYQRSKSMPQQRAQRIRVPSEYHVTKCCTTFSTYRQVYLDELAQMSVQVPTDIKVKR